MEKEELEDCHEESAQGDGVIGEVYERDVVIVDDVIDGAESFGLFIAASTCGRPDLSNPLPSHDANRFLRLAHGSQSSPVVQGQRRGQREFDANGRGGTLLLPFNSIAHDLI